MTFELKDKISVEALKTIIENRVNDSTGKIDGNLNFGTLVNDSETFSIGDIKSIKLNF